MKDDDRYARAKAFFLGPKAENADSIERLLIECFRDHCFWRRNFHPEDAALVGEAERQQAPFLESSADLRHYLNQLMALLKRGSPNYHPRYLGHMHTDLMIAGILGQFATVFYTQNNVTPEASPVTSRLELEVIERIAEMIGFPSTGPLPCRGHLCSGGTVANIEAIWAARNIRHTPISLALGIRHELATGSKEPRKKQVLEAFTVAYLGKQRDLLSLNTAELLNLPIATILALRDDLARSLQGNEKPGGQAIAEAELLLRRSSPEQLGSPEVDRRLIAAGLRPLSDYPWEIYVSTTKHYSFEKIADVLGLGRNALRLIEIRDDFSLDVDILEKTLEERVVTKLADGPCALPLAVIAVMGSTEEGALDDLPGLIRLRERFQKKGLEFWLHTDAAYGGYALSMLRSRQTENPPDDAKAFFSGLLGGGLAKDPLVTETWVKSFNRLESIPKTESVTIDPHKMGYLPYPAGLIFFRDGRTKMAVGCEVPYLFDRPDEDSFPGRYTIEGSRPGHVAAGVYLAHQVLPLDQDGHGTVVGRSMLGARDIYVHTREMVQNLDFKVTLRFICPPALNILNYVICHDEVKTFADQNRLTTLILQDMSAGHDMKRTIPDFDFFAVNTTLELKKYAHVLRPWLDEAGLNVPEADYESGGLCIFRSVVMHHHFLGAKTRFEGKEIPLWQALAHYFVRVCNEKVTVLRREKLEELYRSFPRRARIMIVEDEPLQREFIRKLLLQQDGLDFEPVLFAQMQDAIDWLETTDLAVDLLIADLVLLNEKSLSAASGGGVAVIRKYREKYGPTAPVLVLSQFQGLTQEERRGIDGDDWLDKTELVLEGGGSRFLKAVATLIGRKSVK